MSSPEIDMSVVYRFAAPLMQYVRERRGLASLDYKRLRKVFVSREWMDALGRILDSPTTRFTLLGIEIEASPMCHGFAILVDESCFEDRIGTGI